MDENKVIVSTEMKQALVNLRNLEEIYVIMSGVTKMPFVLCDEETFDDEVLVYYQEESAKEKAKTLAEDRYHVGIAKIEKNARLGFFYKPVYNGRECTGSECWYRGGDQDSAGTACSS